MQASYENFQHYIQEGWLKEPKQFFIQLSKMMEAANLPENSVCLDVGCATGELIHYLSTQFSNFEFFGIDVFEDLLVEARKFLPKQQFVKESILSLPQSFENKFDVITVMGVMSIFDEQDLQKFWEQLMWAVKPGGKVYVLSPLNEFGVDALIKHRKVACNDNAAWEAGWNIYSIDTIKEILSQFNCDYNFSNFQIDIDLKPTDDPIRTWTMKTENNSRQLTNGLKLLVDHYFMEVTKQ